LEKEIDKLQWDNRLINGKIYVVEPGDTLTSIAVMFDVSLRDLTKWNNLEDDMIKIGQQLLVGPPEPDALSETIEPLETEEAIKPSITP
jgi:LysM repeat protein